jgi:hypothetical protein
MIYSQGPLPYLPAQNEDNDEARGRLFGTPPVAAGGPLPRRRKTDPEYSDMAYRHADRVEDQQTPAKPAPHSILDQAPAEALDAQPVLPSGPPALPPGMAPGMLPLPIPAEAIASVGGSADPSFVPPPGMPSMATPMPPVPGKPVNPFLRAFQAALAGFQPGQGPGMTGQGQQAPYGGAPSPRPQMPMIFATGHDPRRGY